MPHFRFRLALIAALSAITVASGFAQTISDSAKQEIAAILMLKKTFNSPENKMSSSLVVTSRLMRFQPVGQVGDLIDQSVLSSPETLKVDIKGAVAPGLLAQIASVGGTVENASPEYGAIRATLPWLALDQIARNPSVKTVSEAEPSMLNVGALTSQGYVSHQAREVVNSLGLTGAGVKVGVLSDSASPARVAALIASGDLGPGTTILPGLAGSGSDEGTALMEIVQDIAPGAQLFFATANGGQAAMSANINALRAAGCDIIVDDFTYFAEGAFEDDIVARGVNQAVAAGALYFSSAANSGNLTNHTSGTWEGDFRNAGPVTGPVLSLEGQGFFHNFGTEQAPQNYDVLTAVSWFISLKWSDPLEGSSNDYDLFILDSTGTRVKAFSAAVQDGTQRPFEFISQGSNCGQPTASGYCPAVGDRIVVVLYSGSPRALRIDTNRGQLSIGTAGATFGHNAGVNTVSVAATYWNSAKTGTRAFTGFANPVETFSSDGPRKLFFNPDGTPITPGNFLFGTNGGTTLLKPDITAADGTSAKTPGFLPFFGTSAAAPHAAAVAALVKAARPSLTNVQIRQVLFDTALDNMAPGPDRDGGRGIVMALPAVQSALR